MYNCWFYLTEQNWRIQALGIGLGLISIDILTDEIVMYDGSFYDCYS